MILRTTGGSSLVRLMQLDRAAVRDTGWLLFGPTDPAVVAPAREPVRPSRPFGSVPSTGRR
jgi:hypothetical protein